MPARALLLTLLLLTPALGGCLETTPPPGDGAGPGLDTPRPRSAGNLTVEFLDVGQGDATVLHVNGTTVLVDAGNWFTESQDAVLNHLRDDGISRLDLLVITHPDADHAGACSEVLDAFPVTVVAHPGSGKDTATWRACEDRMGNEGATVLTDRDLDPGTRLTATPALANLSLQVLHVNANAEDVNAGSLALRVTHGNVTLVLPGDVPCRVEEGILERFPGLDADVLLVGHHGSRTSTCTPWLTALTPEVAVVSSGADDPYGHPHAEVLTRLRDHGARVLLTEEVGTVTVTTDGEGWSTFTEHDDAGGGEDREVTRNGTVAVGEVRYDAPGNDNEALNGEWVEVVNRGNASVELAGWTLRDEAGHEYRFPGNVTIAPGASLRVHTGAGNDTAHTLYWGRTGAVWNNAGDTATLRDATGRTVDARGW